MCPRTSKRSATPDTVTTITIAKRRPEVEAFVDTYLRRAGDLAARAGTVPLIGTSYTLVTQRLTKGVTGTMFKTEDDRKQGIDLLLSQ